MPSIDRTITIQAPVGRVFDFVAEARNATRFQHHFSKFEPVGPLTYGLGMVVDARGRFHGLPVRSRLKVVEFVPGDRIVTKSISGLKNSNEWHFSPEAGWTRVRFAVHYDWPVPILSRSIRKRVESELAQMTDASLKELKILLEAGDTSDWDPPTEPETAMK